METNELMTPTILLCDDEKLECEALVRIFEQYMDPVKIVSVAHNGIDALQAFEKKRPQIVFMDIRMPGMDGLEATSKILEIDPETQIVILSAYGDFSYAQKALRLGILDYVLKPAEPSTLHAILRKAIEKIQHIQMEKQHQLYLEQSLAQFLPSVEGIMGGQYNPIRQAVEYIQKHYREDIRLEQVANEVSLSPAYFSRLFQERVGTSFRHYLIRLRMEAAKHLLVNTDLPVTMIAEAIGYHDTNHFSVRFRRETGESPTGFRRQMGKTGTNL